MALDLARRKVSVSASQLERVARCPGSWKLSLKAPRQELGPEAQHGVRVHAILAGQIPPDATEEERMEARTAWETASWLVFRAIGKALSDLEVEREWQAFLDLGPATLSGRYDLVVWDTKSKQGMVVDYKTGRLNDLELDQNLQLAAGAISLADRKNLEVVHVALVETWRGQYRPEFWTYDAEALNDARETISHILREAVKEQPKLQTGPHCRYCPALTICPKTQELVRWAGGKPKETAEEFAAGLPADRLAQLLNEWKSWVVYIGRALEAEAKRRLEAGEEVPGWTLRPGTVSREITDPTELWRRLKRLGVPPEKFLAQIRIPLSSVDRLLRETLGVRGAEAKEALEQVLEGITTQIQRAPTLKETK